MSSIDNFLTEIYSEELYSISESDYAEVMATPAVDENWQGYQQWSEALEEMPFSEGDVENFETVNGLLRYKGESLKQGQRIGGIEI